MLATSHNLAMSVAIDIIAFESAHSAPMASEG